MTISFLRTSLLGCLAALLFISTASAQENRPDSTLKVLRSDKELYFRLSLGGNNYGGDRDVNPQNDIQTQIENIGLSFGFEAGYAFSERFHLGVLNVIGIYPKVDQNRFTPPSFPRIDQDPFLSEWRYNLNVIGRSHITPRKRFSFYGQVGGHANFGVVNDQLRIGLGPTTGIGADLDTGRGFGVFLELNGMFAFWDRAADKANPSDFAVLADASDFDAFSYLSVGLRYIPRKVPVEIMCADARETTVVTQSGQTYQFAASINPDATGPIDVTWDFGDGTPPQTGRLYGDEDYAPGEPSPLFVEHTFAKLGEYTVTVRASNPVNDTPADQCPLVTVYLPPPVVAIAATPTETCEYVDVDFSSTVTGTATPLDYAWNFGDGATSAQADPSHRYRKPPPPPGAEPGAPADTTRRTVTLNVSNFVGQDTKTLVVAVPTFVDLAAIQFSPVCFNTNDSEVRVVADTRFTPADETVISNVESNLRVLRNNRGVNIRIEGFASPNERNAEGLALARAEAIKAYYVQGGIDASRITTVGTVLPTGPKKRPICTRTIALPCVDPE